MSQPQRLCWSCDAVVPGKVQFCPNCNALQKEMEHDMLAEPRSRGTVNMTQFFVGIVAALAVIIALAIYVSKGRHAPPPLEDGQEWTQQPARTMESPNEITPAQHAAVPGSNES